MRVSVAAGALSPQAGRGSAPSSSAIAAPGDQAPWPARGRIELPMLAFCLSLSES